VNLTPPASIATISVRPAIFEVNNITAMNTIKGNISEMMKATKPVK
jgi:hypothetical protein